MAFQISIERFTYNSYFFSYKFFKIENFRMKIKKKKRNVEKIVGLQFG